MDGNHCLLEQHSCWGSQNCVEQELEGNTVEQVQELEENISVPEQEWCHGGGRDYGRQDASKAVKAGND